MQRALEQVELGVEQLYGVAPYRHAQLGVTTQPIRSSHPPLGVALDDPLGGFLHAHLVLELGRLAHEQHARVPSGHEVPS